MNKRVQPIVSTSAVNFKTIDMKKLLAASNGGKESAPSSQIKVQPVPPMRTLSALSGAYRNATASQQRGSTD